MTDNETLIARLRAEAGNMEYEPFLNRDVLLEAADALELASRPVTVDRDKLVIAIHRGIFPQIGSLASAIGSQEHYSELLNRVSDAILASVIVSRSEAVVKAEAWDEGAKAVMPILAPGMKITTHNPYRAAELLTPTPESKVVSTPTGHAKIMLPAIPPDDAARAAIDEFVGRYSNRALAWLVYKAQQTIDERVADGVFE